MASLHKVFQAVLVCGCVFLVVMLLGFTGVWNGMDRSVYDFFLRVRITSKPLELSPRIIPVDLNDRAERNLGARLNTREAFVQLFSLLGEGNLSAGMDFLFAGSKEVLVDQAMASAAGDMSSLVLAVVPLDAVKTNYSGNPLDEEDVVILRKQLWHPIVVNAGNIPVAATFLMPNRELAKRASLLGHIGVEPDSDGVYRKTALLYRWEDGYMPALSLALAAANLGIDPSRVTIDAGREILLPLPDKRILRVPIDETGSVWIPYPSDWKSGWNRIAMDKLANPDLSDDEKYELLDALSGGILVVADTTTAKKDFGITAFDGLYPLSGVHTSVLNGILTNTFFYSQPLSLQILLYIALFIVMTSAVLRKRNISFHLISAGCLSFLCVLTVILWYRFNVVPFCMMALFAVVFTWGIGFTMRLIRSHEEKLLLENALMRYFPRSLATRILAEKRTELKPTEKRLTVLFADISGFTKWSSDKTPETVHAFLSDYLESMATIIFNNGGTVDKFIGDGILAFFGDPFEQQDHASRALVTALEMQRKADELRDKWQPAVGINLRIRIGINSGPVIVGNLGTKTRIEYTVIGATVNLASRMESNAPVGGILATKDTRNEAGKAFIWGDKKDVAAKGYDQPVIAYVLYSMTE